MSLLASEHSADHLAVVRLLRLSALGPRRLLWLMQRDRPIDVMSSILARRVARPFDEFVSTWRSELERDLRERSDANIVEELADTHVVLFGDAAYPERLGHDVDPPPVLFVRGDVRRLGRIGVAVVGTRHATEYGRSVASALGRDLTASGVDVVSGLALGVDAAAHRGALAARQEGSESCGVPVGVVASGLDVVYPRANGGLWKAVADHGLVIGESPPGTSPDRFRFPLRNRIIAGLAHVVVVVESRTSGGSMITVDEALKRDVPVMAVPGATTTRASDGTNQLLRDGALVATSADDVLAVLGLEMMGSTGCVRDLRVTPRGFDAEVLAVFDASPLDLDQVVQACLPRTLGEVALSLGRLESWGWLRHTSGWFERISTI